MTMNMMALVHRKSGFNTHLDSCSCTRTHTNAIRLKLIELHITLTLEIPGLLQMKSTSDYDKAQFHAITGAFVELR